MFEWTWKSTTLTILTAANFQGHSKVNINFLMNILLLALPKNNDVDVVSSVFFGVLVYRESPCLSRLGCFITVSPLASDFHFIEANVQNCLHQLQDTNLHAFENVALPLAKYPLGLLRKRDEYGLSCLLWLLIVV